MNFTCVKYKNAVRVIKSQKYIEIVKDFKYLSFCPTLRKNQEKLEKNAKSKKFLLLKLFSIVFITIGTIELSH